MQGLYVGSVVSMFVCMKFSVIKLKLSLRKMPYRLKFKLLSDGYGKLLIVILFECGVIETQGEIQCPSQTLSYRQE